jgi:hypothetical protein
MNKSGWKDTVELLGIAAIVASLIFVGLELRQAQRIACAEQEGAQIPDFMAVNALISSNSELISKLNQGRALTETEMIVANSLDESLWQTWFFAHRRAFYLEHPGVDAPAWGLAVTHYENPGLRALWESRRQLRNRQSAVRPPRARSALREFEAQVVAYLEMLDQGGPFDE